MKQLTPEQRDWIIAEYWKLMDKSAVVSRRQLVNGLRTTLESITANTAEDEKLCKCGGVMELRRDSCGIGELYWKCPDCGRVEVE